MPKGDVFVPILVAAQGPEFHQVSASIKEFVTPFVTPREQVFLELQINN